MPASSSCLPGLPCLSCRNAETNKGWDLGSPLPLFCLPASSGASPGAHVTWVPAWHGEPLVSSTCEYDQPCFPEPLLCFLVWPHPTDHHTTEPGTVHLEVWEGDEVGKEGKSCIMKEFCIEPQGMKTSSQVYQLNILTLQRVSECTEGVRRDPPQSNHPTRIGGPGAGRLACCLAAFLVRKDKCVACKAAKDSG